MVLTGLEPVTRYDGNTSVAINTDVMIRTVIPTIIEPNNAQG